MILDFHLFSIITFPIINVAEKERERDLRPFDLERKKKARLSISIGTCRGA